MRILTTQQADEWRDVLQRAARHDFYFLPGYHALAESRGEGDARLFVHEQDGHILALPLLLRSLDEVAELGDGVAATEGWRDATSVYGYAGPLSSHGQPPAEVMHGFQSALRETLLEQRVVAVFSRLHPLLAQQRDLLTGLGECRPGGQTVSLDLTLPPAEQWAQYRPATRTRLNRIHREGALRCQLDPEKIHLAEFVGIYHETMRRVHASDGYFFDQAYFDQLARALGEGLQLFVVTLGGEVIAAGVFTLCDGIVQYHLGATRDAFLRLSPMTLLLDTVRLWGNERGARAFHLGGGVGSRQDSLFEFKANFSHCRHDFATWRWVTAPAVYQRLADERRRWNDERALAPTSADFFPVYRCPSLPRVGPPVANTVAPAGGTALVAMNLP